MKAGLVGPSYQQRSLPFDAQRSVNLFAISDQQGKEVAALYSRPGYNLMGTSGIGPGIGLFTAANGRSFQVSGSGFYEIFADGSSILRGTLNVSQSITTMAENGLQVAICDGQKLYIFTYATNVFGIVTSTNLPSASTVDFISGYFVVSVSNSAGTFQISSLYDGTTWAALDFATAESSPDPLLRVMNVSGQLWLFGSRTVEVWANTGALNFPFQKIAGGTIDAGVMSGYAALSLDNSAFWAGQNVDGNGIVYRADGFSPQRISTETIERRLQAAPSPETLRCTKYQEEGHTFLGITGGGMETTLVYDLATSLWHERAFLNDDGTYGQDLAAEYTFAFGKQIAVDRTSGNFYQQSLDFYSDNGREIARDRVFTHVSNENQRIQFKNLTVGFESGVGNEVDPASNPKAILYISKDGARTWSNGIARAIGKVGKYLTRCTWQRLGQAREMTFRVRVTDPVKVAIVGAYFNE